jgi:hypothetical protein
VTATNELMRQLLTDIPEADRRHLVEVVDRNHAEQLARKRRTRHDPDFETAEFETAEFETDEDD